MTSGKGGFLIYFEPERSLLFDGKARKNEPFSVELSQLDYKPKSRELFLVCFDGKGETIAAAAMVSHKRGPRNTGARNYSFSDFVLFPPIPLEELASELTPGTKKSLVKSSGGVARRISAASWYEVRRVIAGLRPFEAERFNALWEKVCQPPQVETEPDLQNLALERDAVGLAMDCAGSGSTRREVLRKAEDIDPEDPADSFIHYIKEAAPVQERELIEHDKRIFEGLALTDFHVTGELAIGEGKRKLFVRTLDKGKLESAIGVDLLIYVQELASLVMVQYKCCEKESARWTYRPDEQFDDQMDAMRRAEESFEHLRKQRLPLLRSSLDELRYSRLCSAPFYVKFCKRTPLERQDGELCEGVLLRRSDLETLLLSEQGRGPRNGRRIHLSDMPRHLSNTDFAGLVGGGWIGTSHLGPGDLVETMRKMTAESSRLVLAEIRRNGN